MPRGNQNERVRVSLRVWSTVGSGGLFAAVYGRVLDLGAALVVPAMEQRLRLCPGEAACPDAWASEMLAWNAEARI